MKYLAPLALMTAVAIGCLLPLAALAPPFDPDAVCCDHLFYRAMSYSLVGREPPSLGTGAAEGFEGMYTSAITGPWMRRENGLSHQPPYAYRILTPLLAPRLADAAFGGDIRTGFFTLTIVGLLVAAVSMGMTVYRITDSIERGALAIVTFMALHWTAAYSLDRYMLVDPLSWALIGLAVWALMAHRRWAFFALCALGALNKEMSLALVPCYAVREWLDGRIHRDTIVATVALGVGFLVYRLDVASTIPSNAHSPLSAYIGLGTIVTNIPLALGTFGTLGAAFVARLHRSREALALLPLVLGSVAAGAFATDLPRTLIYAFPAVLLAALATWPCGRRGRLLGYISVGGFLLVQGLYELGGLRLLTLAPLTIVLGAGTEILIWREWRRQEHPHQASTV